MSNHISVAADGAPAVMGRHIGVLRLLKNDNPNIMAIHCIIHRENLASATISCELGQLLKKIIRVVNWIKSRPTNERLFKQLCVDMEEFHIRLLLHTRIRWLSKGKCLERFVNLYDAILEFVRGDEEFQFLKSSESKALISYPADIFGKLNALNNELQGKENIFMDCKTEIFGFDNKLKYFLPKLQDKTFRDWHFLSKVSQRITPSK